MKPLWDDLSDLADTLALTGLVNKKELQIMRSASVQMENWFTAVQELRQEKDAAMKRVTEQDVALHALADVMAHSAKFARLEITMDAYGTGVIDKAPFANAMAAFGLNSVGGHKALKKPRKLKVAS